MRAMMAECKVCGEADGVCEEVDLTRSNEAGDDFKTWVCHRCLKEIGHLWGPAQELSEARDREAGLRVELRKMDFYRKLQGKTAGRTVRIERSVRELKRPENHATLARLVILMKDIADQHTDVDAAELSLSGRRPILHNQNSLIYHTLADMLRHALEVPREMMQEVWDVLAKPPPPNGGLPDPRTADGVQVADGAAPQRAPFFPCKTAIGDGVTARDLEEFWRDGT